MIVEIPDNDLNIKDLISREDLIRAIKTECNPYGAPTIDYESGLRVLEIIYRAPTVIEDVETQLLGAELHGIKIGYEEAQKKLIQQQGKWINTSPYDIEGRCSLCRYLSNKCYNFCPNCGSDNRGRRSDDE